MTFFQASGGQSEQWRHDTLHLDSRHRDGDWQPYCSRTGAWQNYATFSCSLISSATEPINALFGSATPPLLFNILWSTQNQPA